MELYINFDSKNKKQIFNFPNRPRQQDREEFDIGELLLDFIELDLSEHEENRLLIKKCFDDPQKLLDIEPLQYIPYYINDGTREYDLEAIRKGTLWHLIFALTNKHYYFQHLSARHYMENYEAYVLLNDKFDFLGTQYMLKEAIDFCLNTDCDELLKDLTIKQRFFLYSARCDSGLSMAHYTGAITGFLLQPIIDDELFDIFYDRSETGEIHDMPYKPLSKEMIEQVKKIAPTLNDNFTYREIDDICFLEFIKMVQSDISVKKCHNCGKYFINNKYKNSIYCNRIPKGETKPCNIVAPRKNYIEKLKENDVAGEYRKRYKKLFGRIKNAAIPEEEHARFKKWKEKAEPLRDKALKNNMDFELFKDELDKIERSIRNGKHP